MCVFVCEVHNDGLELLNLLPSSPNCYCVLKVVVMRDLARPFNLVNIKVVTLLRPLKLLLASY